jgi:hypothetical protein
VTLDFAAAARGVSNREANRLGEQDVAGEVSEPPAEIHEDGLLLGPDQVDHERHEDQVDGPPAHDLVGDAHVAAARVADLRVSRFTAPKTRRLPGGRAAAPGGRETLSGGLADALLVTHVRQQAAACEPLHPGANGHRPL